MQPQVHTFKKEERLCSKKLLEKLFHNGSSFLLYPFSIIWLADAPADGEIPAVRVVISVSKRRFKKATDRNLIKRRIREIYRLNKEALLFNFFKDQHPGILLGISYIGKEIANYATMEKKLKLALEKLKNQCLTSHVD